MKSIEGMTISPQGSMTFIENVAALPADYDSIE
jgi:hypothetical protein